MHSRWRRPDTTISGMTTRMPTMGQSRFRPYLVGFMGMSRREKHEESPFKHSPTCKSWRSKR
eukprot:1575152-Rhodomonas_salina.2